MDLFSPNIWASFSGAFVYYLIMASTPGPNNLILANAGLNFGYRKTVKLIIGIMIGVNLFLLLAILGFSHIFNTYKIIHVIISILGVMFLVYLGIKMAMTKTTNLNADNTDNTDNTDNSTNKANKSNKTNSTSQQKPLSVITMILFQFSNIKSMIVGVSLASLYHKDTMLDTYIFLSAVTLIAIVLAGNVWILFGSILARFLKNPRNAKIFNIVMGLTLVVYSLSLLPIDDIKTFLNLS